MSTRYPIKLTMSTSELDYGTVSAYSSTTITTYFEKTDYVLILTGNSSSINANDDNVILKDDIKKAVITGKYPNNIEFTIDNVQFEVVSKNPGSQWENRYYDVIITLSGDQNLTAVIGNVPCLLKLYGNDNNFLASAQFGVIVKSTEALPFFTHQRYVDFWPGAIPTRIHVNQGDSGIVLRLDAFHRKDSMRSIISTNGGGSISVRYSLEGIRPDGYKLNLTGTKTKVTNTTCYFAFNLDNSFTQVPGEVVLQIVITTRNYSLGSQAPTKEIKSSKIILVVEPTS